MSWLDTLFLVIIGIAGVKGCFRGLVRELASLAGLVVGFLAANAYAPRLLPHIQAVLTTPLYAQVASYAVVFLSVVLAIILLSAVLRKLLAAGGLSGLDRFMGGLFGLLKGVLISCLVLLLLTAFLPPRSGILLNSNLSPFLQRATRVLTLYLPDGLRQKMAEKGSDLRQAWEGEWIEEKRRETQRTLPSD